ncbi:MULTISPECIES: bifunctional diaminohydroxyphosphoribosylaminopyrimidine deaminase/5-amino-6-(5-phosphoribosylamino)uracil reductase RibD [unclassified Novosphingobium]|uniref:bifunctional diaminohydroxyphosphoribosylaminopyrimidine deaminase/5-amino-6-(5-phosphoribosylamino)uracil reductase RibD n=1 Tax=unclassified Novosphingobium TaxID=2644732 RepID=UPI00146CBDC4|nr:MULTISPECIES: bifunctional diaminohydroxyphosphoribosylaminopyrimidine deaminase/5-amino-6-(5-phosphoribosylamino)uracil reductase RibD [unclassified Novosphingobium]NMN05978.1 diaminohydroxyphosphoribosylaminopyrimidine deaminase/5-amino-6-(5-phosphoribosylamino)uracil reductase [Novosphingobium sp. SG919]NMN88274.1 diaminohydroxyphosphoribosylaminopyrimidine deaminase/5-amino-6-(5-phosphoribosylamino)uracil reductase [Novosphingobium sp. SG916]
MTASPDADRRWLAAAAALSARGRPLSAPNPAVGCVIVRQGRVIARGWTQPGGRPHAEAMALAGVSGDLAGATVYVSLEPCAHASVRGPSCTDLLVAARPARVVVGHGDPDPRTAGAGLARLRAAGIATDLLPSPACAAALAGFLLRTTAARPHVTLKLALTLDGAIALANGQSRWITGPEARAHCHAERARADAILVGGGTLRADAPRLDVRLPGLEPRSPQRWVLTRGAAPDGWHAVADVTAPRAFGDVQWLFVEGGAGAAATFLRADLVDRLLLYRAPILVGPGLGAVGNLGLETLASAHGRWGIASQCQLGSDTLTVYDRCR